MATSQKHALSLCGQTLFFSSPKASLCEVTQAPARGKMLTLVAQTLTHSITSLGIGCTYENTPRTQSYTHVYSSITLAQPCTGDVLSLFVWHFRAATVKFPGAYLTGLDIEVLSWGSLWNGVTEGRIRREIWGDKGKVGESFKESDFHQWACNKWERWLQWQPLPSGMKTAVYTVYRMGYQLCNSIGTGTDRVIWLDWFQLSLRWQ